MEEKYELLTDKHKRLLLILWLFGSQETDLNFIFDNFINPEEKELYKELILDLAANEWISLNKNYYSLNPDIQSFILKNHRPQIKDFDKIYEYFLEKLNETNQKLTPQIEQYLINVLARSQNKCKNSAYLYFLYAQYLYQNKNYKSSTYFFELAVKQYENLQISDVSIINTYNFYADSLIKTGQLDRALQIAYKSVSQAFNIIMQSPEPLVYAYSLIANIYSKQKKYKQAFSIHEKILGLQNIEKINKKLYANIYYETAVLALKAKKYEQAMILLNKTQKILKDTPFIPNKDELQKNILIHKENLKNLLKIDKLLKLISSTKWILILSVLIIIIIFSIIFIN